MTNPVQINVQDGALGGGAASSKIHWLVGDCSAGTANTVETFGSVNDVKTTLGYGPLVRDVEDVLTKLGGTVKAVKAGASVSSYLTGTVASGYPATLAISGTPNDLYNIVAKVTKAGIPTSNSCLYQISLDGGESWTPESLLAASNVIVGSGLTLTTDGATFHPVGTMLTGRAEPKVSTGADITAALSCLSGVLGAGTPDGLLISVETTSPVTGAAIFDSVNTFVSSLKTNYTFAVPFVSTPTGGGDIDGLTDAQYTTAANNMVTTWASKANSGQNPIAVAAYRGRRSLSQPLQSYGKPFTSLACQLYTDTLKNEPYVDPGAVVQSGPIGGMSEITYDETIKGDTISPYLVCIPITYIGKSGFYWKKGVLKAAAGSDFRNIHSSRVFYIAYNSCANECFGLINKTLPVKSDGTGFLTPAIANWIDDKVGKRLDTDIMQQNGPNGIKGWASAISFKVDRAYNLLTSEQVRGTFSMVPLGIARTISITMSFATQIAK